MPGITGKTHHKIDYSLYSVKEKSTTLYAKQDIGHIF